MSINVTLLSLLTVMWSIEEAIFLWTDNSKAFVSIIFKLQKWFWSENFQELPALEAAICDLVPILTCWHSVLLWKGKNNIIYF